MCRITRRRNFEERWTVSTSRRRHHAHAVPLTATIRTARSGTASCSPPQSRHDGDRVSFEPAVVLPLYALGTSPPKMRRPGVGAWDGRLGDDVLARDSVVSDEVRVVRRYGRRGAQSPAMASGRPRRVTLTEVGRSSQNNGSVMTRPAMGEKCTAKRDNASPCRRLLRAGRGNHLHGLDLQGRGGSRGGTTRGARRRGCAFVDRAGDFNLMVEMGRELLLIAVKLVPHAGAARGSHRPWGRPTGHPGIGQDEFRRGCTCGCGRRICFRARCRRALDASTDCDGLTGGSLRRRRRFLLRGRCARRLCSAAARSFLLRRRSGSRHEDRGNQTRQESIHLSDLHHGVRCPLEQVRDHRGTQPRTSGNGRRPASNGRGRRGALSRSYFRAERGQHTVDRFNGRFAVPRPVWDWGCECPS